MAISISWNMILCWRHGPTPLKLSCASLAPGICASMRRATWWWSGNTDEGYGIAVDAAGNAYITGSTGSRNFPTTAGALQTTYGGGFYDAFVSKLDPMGSALLYSTYLGGGNTDEGHGIAVDAAGNAYITGSTGSRNFPTTVGALQITYGGGF